MFVHENLLSLLLYCIIYYHICIIIYLYNNCVINSKQKIIANSCNINYKENLFTFSQQNIYIYIYILSPLNGERVNHYLKGRRERERESENHIEKWALNKMVVTTQKLLWLTLLIVLAFPTECRRLPTYGERFLPTRCMLKMEKKYLFLREWD